MAKRSRTPKSVETLTHGDATRKNIPTAEYQPVMRAEDQAPIRVAYQRRNRDLDPQLVWRGKDEQDWSDLVVPAPPLFIQEKVHPKVLIDDLLRQSEETATTAPGFQPDLFADFNGLPDPSAATEFYQHDANWSNRMILGDSLQVMASLAEREGLRGQVQCIYIDPPYGIKFNSNFQWSTTSRDVRDGKREHITREPEQVKAFRDTWRDGIHSYLTYLRDRLTVARDLLTESGSVFVQIGDENVHRVRVLMDEVFGDENFVGLITFMKATAQTSTLMSTSSDYLIWYAKSKPEAKYRVALYQKVIGQAGATGYRNVESADGTVSRRITPEEKYNPSIIPKDERVFTLDHIRGTRSPNPADLKEYTFQGVIFNSDGRWCWKTDKSGLDKLGKAGRLVKAGNQLSYKRYFGDFVAYPMTTNWSDTAGATNKRYVVETSNKVIQRCILMTTDPGDLVLDPTCGSGTTAYVAEQWGRRWITIDTSRVALALARARIMGARYPYYLLADSAEGQRKEAEISRTAPSETPAYNDIRQGFVYQRVPHITLRDIANNAEIDIIWEKYQKTLEPLRASLNEAVNEDWREWEIPHEADESWSDAVKALHGQWWEQRIARQTEIDASIAAKADCEYLYDKPYEERKKVRVAGPFTVDSLSPHRVLGIDENDDLIDSAADPELEHSESQDFSGMILEHLKTAGVQQARKDDRIAFSSLAPWPGDLVCAEGTYAEGDADSGIYKRAGIFIGPEFGTVSRPDLARAVREAGEADFDVLIACAFNYDAQSTDFDKLGRVPVLKARMNADLHMADDLKNTGKGNLFVIFGEPDISVASEEWLVDGSERRIAPYDIFKLVSGTDRLAEVNRLDREELRAHAALSRRGEIWDYLTDAACRVLNSGEHRGGTGKANNEGISPVAWHCAGSLSGGTGNLSDLMRKAGTDTQRGFRELVGRLRRDQQNAQRADEITRHAPLTTRHYTQVTVHGVDVFHPNTGEIRSDDADGIACWFIDTDYNEESFFVRHAYFLGASDPYKSLKTTLKAEIDPNAWATLHSDTSRPFAKPISGRIAVKVINHLGDEVMKVFRVS